MKIAITGIRGIPACYGGFETFAEELAPRLVARGHEVVVYGRTHVIKHTELHYRGVEIRLLPAPKHKYLETPVHSLRSFLHLLRNRVDVVLVCNAANSPFIFIPRFFGCMPVAVNVDGIERKRAKWNWLGKTWYLLGEITSVVFANLVIADAEVIANYYQSTYHRSATVIAYGYHESRDAEVVARLNRVSNGEQPPDGEANACAEASALFDELQVSPGEYILYVARLEPENNAHVVIEAHLRLPEPLRRFPLVVVGDAPYANDYIAQLRASADSRIRFAGYRFGSSYQTLQLNARAYIQATDVGGTHPALVEAMGFGNCVIANATPENEEVLADAGLFYRKNDSESLASVLTDLIDNESELRRYQILARNRAEAVYRWDLVADAYEAALEKLVKRH